MGKLIGIAIKKDRGSGMVQLQRATVSTETGVEYDRRGKPGRRQVTVVAKESWDDACEDLQAEVEWTARRANLFIEGIPLIHSTGKTLHIGEVVLEISGETTPCKRMDELHHGLMKALEPNWRGGVICKVINGGDIKLGDKAKIGDA